MLKALGEDFAAPHPSIKSANDDLSQVRGGNRKQAFFLIKAHDWALYSPSARKRAKSSPKGISGSSSGGLNFWNSSSILCLRSKSSAARILLLPVDLAWRTPFCQI